MAVPQLTPLPPPPLPTDSEAVFNAKAGPSLNAQVTMVAQYNSTVMPWVAQQLADTQAARDAGIAARDAAQQAQLDAEQAATNATNNGAAQVALAAAQANLAYGSAVDAKNSEDKAALYASLAEQGAGLPATTGKSGWSLVVNPDGDGYDLKLVSQVVGDVLVSAKTPDGTYVEEGKPYLKSAYPALYSLLGTVTDTQSLGRWQNPLTTTPVYLAAGNGYFVATAQSGSTGILRSAANNGSLYANVTTGGVAVSGPVFFMDNQFVVISSATPGTYYTSPDGSTWTTRSSGPNSTNITGGAYGNSLCAILYGGSGFATAPSPTGPWTNKTGLTTSLATQLIFGNGMFVATSTTLIRSTPDGNAAWTDRTPPNFAGSGFIGAAFGNGQFFFAGTVRSFSSPDLVNWTQHPGIEGLLTSPLFSGNHFEMFVNRPTDSFTAKYFLTYTQDFETYGLSLETADRGSTLQSASLSGRSSWLNQTGTRAFNSWLFASYDTATQFYVPGAARPYKTKGYMKAKLS